MARLDAVIADTEEVICKPGACYILPSIVQSLRLMQSHITAGTLTQAQRQSFRAGMGRALLEDFCFAEGPIGTRILKLSHEFAEAALDKSFETK